MTRCQGITLGGSRCKKSCKETHCWQHQKSDECGICLDSCNQNIILDCKHTFCNKCINEWICVSDNHNCPVCRVTVSRQIKSDAFSWGVGNNILGVYHNVDIDLSQFDNGFQELFMLYTDIEKNKRFSVSRITEIRKEIHFFTEFKQNWNIMFDKNNIKHSEHFFINESREKLEKSIVFFTFI
jgi:hypothetical protein